LKARQLPTFKEFLTENRNVLVEEVPWLTFYFAMMVLVWMFEQMTRSSMVWPVPLHWAPEIGLMLEAGEYFAKLKRTVIPTELLIAIGAMGLAAYSGSLLEFSLLGWIVAAVFVTPLVVGYCLERFLLWRRVDASKSGN